MDHGLEAAVNDENKDSNSLKKKSLMQLVEGREQYLDPNSFIESSWHPEFLFQVLKNMVRNGKRYDANKDNVINEIVHFLFDLHDRDHGIPYQRNVVSFEPASFQPGQKSTEYFQILYPDIDIDYLVGIGQKMWNSYLGHDLYPLIKWADIEVHRKNGDTRLGGNNFFIHNTRQLHLAKNINASEMALTDIILSDTTESEIGANGRRYDQLSLKHSQAVLDVPRIEHRTEEKPTLTYRKRAKGKGKRSKKTLFGTDITLRQTTEIKDLEAQLNGLKDKSEDQNTYYSNLKEVLIAKLPDHDESYIDELLIHNRLLTGTKGRQTFGKDKVELYHWDMKAIFKYAGDRFNQKDHRFHESYKDLLIAKYTDLIDNTLFYTELAEPKQRDRAMKNQAFLEEARQFYIQILEKGEEVPDELLWLHEKLVTHSLDLATSLKYTFSEKSVKAEEYKRKVDQFQEIIDYFQEESRFIDNIFPPMKKLEVAKKFINPYLR